MRTEGKKVRKKKLDGKVSSTETGGACVERERKKGKKEEENGLS